ncbi:MAG: acyl carrier protein [Fibrobacteraceae bacterium]|nr:acyl carrier protein [Fibrobacteraceae bacterium]
MNIQTFVKNFAEQFDDTDIREIKKETKFQELEEWSSLILISIIAMIKTEYGKNVTGPEIRKCNTVKDLFDLVASK